MKDNYLWIIGGGQLQIFLIEEAKKLGLKTIVSDLNPKCIAKDRCDIFVHLDIFDIDAHLRYLNNSSLNIVGVLAAGIDAPETMAAMNENLNIKGISLKTALLVKNKDKFRLKLKELKYPTPEFRILTNKELPHLTSLLDKMPYPLIVKPTNNCGSRDMKIFHQNSLELRKFIQDKLNIYQTLLIEEMWQGEEQTVECLVDIDGNFHNGFITDRKFTFKDSYPIELGLVHPSQLDEYKQQELFLLAKNIARDLKIDVGAVKLDTIYTDKGPRIIELTVRHSGGYDCQLLVPSSTGKNILKAAILTAIGKKFDTSLLENRLNKFGVTGSIWPKSGKITSISGLNQAKKIAGVESIFLAKNIGDTVRAYTDCAARVIFIITIGNSLLEAQTSLKQAQDCIKIETLA